MASTGSDLTQAADAKLKIPQPMDPTSIAFSSIGDAYKPIPLNIEFFNTYAPRLRDPIPIIETINADISPSDMSPYFKATFEAIHDAIHLEQRHTPEILTANEHDQVCRYILKQRLNHCSAPLLNVEVDNNTLLDYTSLPASVSNIINDVGPILVDEGAYTIVPTYVPEPTDDPTPFTGPVSSDGSYSPMLHKTIMLSLARVQNILSDNPQMKQEHRTLFEAHLERNIKYQDWYAQLLPITDDDILPIIEKFSRFVNIAHNSGKINIGTIDETAQGKPFWILYVEDTCTLKAATGTSKSVLIRTNYWEATQDDVFKAAIVQSTNSKSTPIYTNYILSADSPMNGVLSTRKLYATGAEPENV
ncbi:CLUMA_CG018092, isoform A [Clunio marinus]|uniref:CLUMA_CG018092, isoform A n=1 Tax=Clunio marinus TaxID=568069 RepID=A0A1J1IXT7_9DIPT|nr:CLUMA_CG018092, isoform A [Clunio marinus]